VRIRSVSETFYTFFFILEGAQVPRFKHT